jgi:hypothetical protein
VSVCVTERGRIQFPSVLLQPLGHLSASLESVVYGPVAEPETSNCVRPPNVPRALTVICRRLTGSSTHHRPLPVEPRPCARHSSRSPNSLTPCHRPASCDMTGHSRWCLNRTCGRGAATIRSTHPWRGNDAFDPLSSGDSPPTQISTQGEANSRRGCRGTFGSVRIMRRQPGSRRTSPARIVSSPRSVAGWC